MSQTKYVKFLDVVTSLLLGVLFIAVLIINVNAHMYPDDYLYAFQFNPGFATTSPSMLHYEYIDNIGDYFHSLLQLYQNLTGRIVPHGLLQLSLLVNAHVFDIINTLMLFLLAFLMVKWVLGTDCKLWKQYMLLSLGLYYIAVSSTIPNLYIAAFSCNYLWTQVIILTFLYPLRLYMSDDNAIKDTPIFNILMFITGLIAGDTNEPVIPGVLVVLFLYGGYLLFAKKKIPFWYVSASVSLLLGYCFLFFAPGNSQRAIYEERSGAVDTKIMFHPDRLKILLFNSINCFPAVIIGTFSALYPKRYKTLEAWYPLFALIIISGTTFLTLFFVPIISERMNILYVGFIVMICLYFIHWSRKTSANLLLLFFLLIFPFFGLKLYSDYQRMEYANKENKLFEQEIAHRTSDSLLVAPRSYMDPITRQNWAKPIATYYGLNSLWVYDVLSDKFLSKRQPITFTTVKENCPNDFTLKTLEYCDINEFTRIIYFKFDVKNDLHLTNNFLINYFYININSSFLKRIYLALPLRLQFYIMKQQPQSRVPYYKIKDHELLYSLPIQRSGNHVDFVRIRIAIKSGKTYNLLLKDVAFR